MPEKPSYLGLLNAIAVGESRAHEYFSAWIDKTSDPALKDVLTTICLREGEHGMAFTKRINELGFSVREKPDPVAEKAKAIASSDMSDLEKIEKLGLGQPLHLFDNVFLDHSIDVQTGELLGRYIAEEHDTNRLIRSCCAQLQARRDGNGGGEVADQLATLGDRVDTLCQAVEELRDMVCAQSSVQPSPVTRAGKRNKPAAARTRRAS